jgi:hypothetical protein
MKIHTITCLVCYVGFVDRNLGSYYDVLHFPNTKGGPNVKGQFSATMDMWTFCQNKSYMCVTIHWVDEE